MAGKLLGEVVFRDLVGFSVGRNDWSGTAASYFARNWTMIQTAFDYDAMGITQIKKQ